MSRRRDDKAGPVYFTTFQVAKVLGVSAPTVVNWVNGGLLVAHRTPGGHRRMTREDILAFAAAHDYPVGPELLGDSPAPAPSGESRRVLIVDDDPDYCALVKDYLEGRGGWVVESANSGFNAGLAVARFSPAVVLLDLMMPGMDGFQVLSVLQADPLMRRIPVVACTAWRDDAVEERVRREAFRGYVLKQAKLEALLEALESALTPAR